MKCSTRPMFVEVGSPSFLLPLAAFVRRASINKGLCGVPTVRLTGERKSAWKTNTEGVLVVFVVLLAFAPAFAQTGTIVGTVSDTSGAVVEGAQITARNTATNESHQTTSSTTGAYAVTNLAVGPYEIMVKKEGFKLFRLPNIQLTVAQSLTVDAKLTTGSVTEEVTVRGDLVRDVDLETSQISNLVDQREMVSLPLITRNPYQLVLLSPGTSQTDSIHGGFSVNGARDRNNNFLLDGVDNNDTSVPGASSGVLSANPDSTQEFRVITDNFNAEYGRNTGAIMHEQMTNALAAGKTIMEANTLEEVKSAQSDFVKDCFDRALDGHDRIAKVSARTTKEAVEPAVNHVNETVGRLSEKGRQRHAA